MKTWSLYQTADDQMQAVENSNGVLAIIQAAAAGNALGTTQTGIYNFFGGAYFLDRTGLQFDCTPILGMVITSGQVFIGFLIPPDAGVELVLVDGSGLHRPLILPDYGLLLPRVVHLGDVVIPITTPLNLPIPLNAGGLAQIVPGGFTQFGLRTTEDITVTDPGFGINHDETLILPTLATLFNSGGCQVTTGVIGGTFAQLNGILSTLLGGSVPPILQVSGPGSGNFSNLDVRISAEDPFAHFFYTPWRNNQGLEDLFTDTLHGLTPLTYYDVNFQFRIHGTATVYTVPIGDGANTFMTGAGGAAPKAQGHIIG